MLLLTLSRSPFSSFMALDNAKNHASSLDINVDDIEDKAKEQANAWKEKWKKDKKKGSEMRPCIWAEKT